MDFNRRFPSSQPPFFNDSDNLPTNQIGRFSPEDLLEIRNAWDINIDPLLENMNHLPPQGWQNQQQPMQRFMDDLQRPLFDAPPSAYPQRPMQSSALPSMPVASHPYAKQTRMGSPAPSQDLTSTGSSAMSPPAETYDLQSDMGYYSPAQSDFFPTASQHASKFYDSWGGSAYPANNHVNMSQIQGFADPQEFNLEADEGFADFHETKGEYSTEQHQYLHSMDVFPANQQLSYTYPTDEGIGASIKDHSSPIGSHTSDLDAEGEVDDEEPSHKQENYAESYGEPSEDEDTEYTPRSSRTRKRRFSSSAPTRQSPATKRARTTKALPRTKASKPIPMNGSHQGGAHTCPTCPVPAPSFSTASLLQKHVASAHTRPFECVFSFAGCTSTFASKNEWKRHVQSQHLNFSSWICTLGACNNSTHGHGQRGSEFNRKDLFTQHCRRMHSPAGLKKGQELKSRAGKSNSGVEKIQESFEEQLKEWQETCLVVKRTPPTKLACPVSGCNTVWQGSNTWDERMEHVGKHLESASKSESKHGSRRESVRQVDDRYLVEWAISQGVIARKAGGGYKFPKEGEVATSRRSLGVDDDADGEEE